jgi:hypothetical protein
VSFDDRPARGRKDEYGEPPATYTLLVSKVLIRGDQRVERRFRSVQQFAIAEFSPSHLEGSGNRMALQKSAQWYRSSLVEQYSQTAAPPRIGDLRDG